MPPPPPPPAPPPLPGGLNACGKTNNFAPPDRNALLSQIRKGTRLKKAETNDRSAPIIDGSKSSNSSNNHLAKRNVENKANGPFPVIPPGGLFAQGIPKLKPTASRSGDGTALSSLDVQSIKTGGNSSSLDHLRVGQLSGSRSQPPSPVSKPRLTSNIAPIRTSNTGNLDHSSGNPNFPDDINIKGPAPVPPPASQKPNFKTSSSGEDASIKHSTVKRSASQTNLGQRPRLTRPPPNVKPPPPPKSNTTTPQTAPPPPPSKPPNILRRQSFGVAESHNSRLVSSKLSVVNNMSKPAAKGIGPPPPPPPPRNNSAPNDLNQMVISSSPNSHWNKMNTAPPPPPNRAAPTSNRSVPTRPPPPRAPAPPPPPPQHMPPVHPAPPSQMKATPAASFAPPPPVRVSSMKQASEFEERFKTVFCAAQNLPKPEKFTNIHKTYPSKTARQKQTARRLPPPPPPGANGTDISRSQPVLHIQLDSGIFSSGVAHC